MRWEDLPEVPEYVFRVDNEYPCFACKKQTHFIPFGMNLRLCSTECLRREVEKRVQVSGLRDYVTVKI